MVEAEFANQDFQVFWYRSFQAGFEEPSEKLRRCNTEVLGSEMGATYGYQHVLFMAGPLVQACKVAVHAQLGQKMWNEVATTQR